MPENEPLDVLVERLCHRCSRLAQGQVAAVPVARQDARTSEKRRLLIQIEAELERLTALYD
jgi:RNA polymerase subunit RPABC4/transcription elongation factor Spt4